MDREYIGFASLPDQIHRKTIKKGFEFTLMVAGESGLGKSTLVNTLFLTDLYQDRVIPPVEGKGVTEITVIKMTDDNNFHNNSERLTKTTAIQVRTADIEEMGIKLRLTIVDTPGTATLSGASSCFLSGRVENISNDDSRFRRRFKF